jgi:hypothetical protein
VAVFCVFRERTVVGEPNETNPCCTVLNKVDEVDEIDEVDEVDEDVWALKGLRVTSAMSH